MKVTLHRAQSRGVANHGWLKSNHSFSFASYYNPERMGFGLLRVLNDDQVAPSEGFGTHPHQNMEIVSIPLTGSLQHKDSEGNQTVIQHGEVQLMSAGTGVLHSEYNHSNQEEVNFLQIWVIPEKLGIKPRYDQKKFSKEGRKNTFQRIVSPIGSNEGGVKINQQAYFSLIDLDIGNSAAYKLHDQSNGVYLFVLNGELSIEGEMLQGRDALGIEGVEKITIQALADAQALLIEVPMG